MLKIKVANQKQLKPEQENFQADTIKLCSDKFITSATHHCKDPADDSRQLTVKLTRGGNLFPEAIVRSQIFPKKQDPEQGKEFISQQEQSNIAVANDYDDVQDPYQLHMEKATIDCLLGKLENKPVERVVGHNMIVPLRFLRGSEALIIKLLNRLDTLEGFRLLILSNNNKRADQILQTIESDAIMEKGLQIGKYLSLKKKTQVAKEFNRETDMSKHLFIMLNNRFSTMLLHRELFMTDFDLIIVDEINSVTETHPITNVMQNYYFNSDIPFPQLPVVVGCFAIESQFSCVTNEEAVEQSLQAISNTLNASLFMLSEKEVRQVQTKYFRELQSISFKDNSPLEFMKVMTQHIALDSMVTRYVMELQSPEKEAIIENKEDLQQQGGALSELAGVKESLSDVSISLLRHLQLPIGVEMQGSKCIIKQIRALKISPSPKLFEQKLLQREVHFKIGRHILHQSDCQKVLDTFGALVNQIETEVYNKNGIVNQYIEKGQKLGLDLSDVDTSFLNSRTSLIYKPVIRTVQHVLNKVRYFSSWLEVDPQLLQIFSKIFINVKQNSKLLIFSRDVYMLDGELISQSSNQPLIFKKKLEKESNLVLDIIYLLFKSGFIQENLKGNTLEITKIFEEKKAEFIKIMTGKLESIINDSCHKPNCSCRHCLGTRVFKMRLGIFQSFSLKRLIEIQVTKAIMQNQERCLRNYFALICLLIPSTFLYLHTKATLWIPLSPNSSLNQLNASNNLKRLNFQLAHVEVVSDNIESDLKIYEVTEADQDLNNRAHSYQGENYIEDSLHDLTNDSSSNDWQSHNGSFDNDESLFDLNITSIEPPISIVNELNGEITSENNFERLTKFVELLLLPYLETRKKYQAQLNSPAGEDGSLFVTGAQLHKNGIVWCETKQPKTEKYNLIFEAEACKENFKDEQNLFIKVKENFIDKAKQFDKRRNRQNLKCTLQKSQSSEQQKIDMISLTFSREEGIFSAQDVNELRSYTFKINEEGTDFRLKKEFKNEPIKECHNLIPSLIANASKVMRCNILESPKFNALVSRIGEYDDLCVLPEQITSHLESDLRASSNSFILLLFSIAVLQNSFSNQSDNIREEISRLIFVGDSAINLAVVLHLSLAEDVMNMEKELDHKKISFIKSTNISLKCNYAGLSNILLEDQDSQSSDKQTRTLDDVFQSIMGFFAVYFGFDAAQLLMYDMKIIQNYPGLLRKREAKIDDSNFKVEILNQLSLLHRKQFGKKFYKKFATFLFYRHIDKFTDLRLMKEDYEKRTGQKFSPGQMHQLYSGMLVYKATTDKPEDWVIEKTDPDYINRLRHIEQEDDTGYKFRQRRHILESMTHKSVSEKMINQINTGQVKLDAQDFKEIFQEMKLDSSEEDKEQINRYSLKLRKYGAQKLKQNVIKALKFFDYQRNEYLGDSLLNFSAAKLFYLDTMEQNLEPWQDEYTTSSKLHELKTFFTSNLWLGFLICENYLFSLGSDYRNLIMDKLDKEENTQQAITYIPLIPILNNEQNQQYDSQIKIFQAICQKMIADGSKEVMAIKNRKFDTSFKYPLSLQRFLNSPRDEADDLDLELLATKFVKLLSDVHEALIGAIFADCGNLVTTEKCISMMISPRYAVYFPLKENSRTKVLNILNSKKYCQNLKVTHSIEDRKEDVYIKTYIQNIEARRLKFKKEQKKKISKNYNDFQKFMEEAYFQFEVRYQNDFTVENFLKFIRAFRKDFNVKTYSKDPQIISSIADEILLFCKENTQNDKLFKEIQEFNHKKKQSTTLVNTVKKILTSFYLKHAEKPWDLADYEPKINKAKISHLILMEHERVRYNSIRLTLQKAGIGHIIAEKGGFEGWLDGLSNQQVCNLFCHLKRLAEAKQINQPVFEASMDQAQMGGAGAADNISLFSFSSHGGESFSRFSQYSE